MNKMLKLTMLFAAMMGNYAKAEIEPGFYKAHFKNSKGRNDGRARIFIENAMVDGVSVSYGLILNDKIDQAAAFKIEELPDGTQAWIRLTQKAAGLIGSNANQDAIYNVNFVKEGMSQKLIFTPTAYASTLGCSAELVGKKRHSQSWEELPIENETFKGRGKQRVIVRNNQITGRYYVAGVIKNGSSAVSEVIPNVGAVRAQALNSESEDGRSMDRQMTALITIIHKKWNLFNQDRLKVIKISASGCFDDTSTLHN